ncbi:hypothetical protein EZV62_003024 [Acer yangbiense]|uniref:Uncharacterized protein n=1 Tax=Acer yangbiense TaxID=1000413 RepID=A0A5C7IYV1_9ROSI|nr:hypothetical protein EZV62_003024 [Acer yangbiense]
MVNRLLDADEEQRWASRLSLRFISLSLLSPSSSISFDSSRFGGFGEDSRWVEHEGGDHDEDRIPGFSSTNVADLRKGFRGCSRRVNQLILEAFIYLEWLDSQSAGSVLYVSLGSYLSVSSEQRDEIAAGLKSSCDRFLWVARDETSRLKNSCGDLGLIVSWCDQLKQIVENWKVGWSVREKAGDENTIRREEIAKLVQEFMDRESIEVQNIRKRAKQLGDICHQAVEKGGSSETNMDVFINHISQDHSS